MNISGIPSRKRRPLQWEAEIDRLMRAQASAMDNQTRKKYFDRVQEIVSEQAPFIYLVNKNALMGISPLLEGAQSCGLAAADLLECRTP